MTRATAASVRDELMGSLHDLDEEMQVQACELTLLDFGGGESCDDDNAEVFETFARSVEERRRDLLVAWLDRDLERLRQAAHAIRVAAGSFGLHAASELAKRVERAVAFQRSPRELLVRLAALLLVIEPSVVLAHKPGPSVWRKQVRAG